ncbi:MAG: HPr family phosphocarrier protein [Eisenbergiella sp.]
MNNIAKVRIKLRGIDEIKRFSNIARGFSSDINVSNGRTLIDAKSIMGMFNIDLSSGGWAEIITDDPSEIKRFNSLMKEFETC